MPRTSHFPSLLLVTNTHHALWFEVQEKKLKKLSERKEEKAHYSDQEGFSQSGGRGKGARSGSSKEGGPMWVEEEHRHLKEVVKMTKQLWAGPKYQHLIIIASNEVSHQLTKAFRSSTFASQIISHDGNHTHDSSKKLMDLVIQTLYPALAKKRKS